MKGTKYENRTRSVFIAVALVLVAADPPNTAKLVPPDDPADVTTVRELCHGDIDLDSNGNVTGIGVSGADLGRFAQYGPALSRLGHVRSLGAHDAADQVLRLVRRWTALDSANLGDVSDAGLAGLEHMQTLKRLRVSGWDVTDAGVISLAKLKNLEWLTIEDAAITDACMKDIASLPRLKELDLTDNPITDAGLAQVKGMKLQSLTLRTTRITDGGIDAIKDMTTLKDLDVIDTKVTNAALAKLKGIADLNVRGLPREDVHEVPDDPEDVAAIQAASLRITPKRTT